MKKIAIALPVVIIAIAAAALAYLVFVRGIPLRMIPLLWQSQPKEHSATYYPDDTIAYFWMTLNPSDGQRTDMLGIWERFNEIEEFEDARAELENRLYELTGMRFEDDVLPWIGTEVSAGVLNATSDDYGELEDLEAVVTVEVRDFGAAEIFMRKFLKVVEEETYAQFDDDTLSDFKIWVAEDDSQSYGLSKELLIAATTESTLLDMIRRVGGDGSENLTSSEAFAQARAALPERRFSSVYVDLQGIGELLTNFSGDIYPVIPSGVGDCPVFGSIPNWVAASAAWQRKSISLEVVSPASESIFSQARGVADAAQLLPDDTLGFVAFSFEPDMDKWRESLDECRITNTIPFFDEYAIEEFNASVSDLDYIGLDNVDFDDMPRLTENSTLADMLDLGLWLVDEQTGIHLEEEFTDYLAGDMVMSVRDFRSFDAVMEADTVEVVLLMSYRNDAEQALSETMEDIFGLFDTYIGAGTIQEDVGANSPAELLDLNEMFGGTGFEYAPGFVLHDGYLSLGSDRSALESVVSRQNGEKESLKSTALYNRTSRYLFEGGQSFVYVDAHRIVGKFEPSDLEVQRDEYELLKESIGAVGVSSRTVGDYDRANVVFTLFPEDDD